MHHTFSILMFALVSALTMTVSEGAPNSLKTCLKKPWKCAQKGYKGYKHPKRPKGGKPMRGHRKYKGHKTNKPPKVKVPPKPLSYRNLDSHGDKDPHFDMTQPVEEKPESHDMAWLQDS